MRGYLYYIRLKTDTGTYYKIGFTKKSNINRRFNENDSEDYLLIDKILLFKFLSNAYEIEQELHQILSTKSAFGKYARDKLMPLAGRGQSELYRRDVLSLDKDYSKWSYLKTIVNETKKRLYTHPVEYLFTLPFILLIYSILLVFGLLVLTLRLIGYFGSQKESRRWANKRSEFNFSSFLEEKGIKLHKKELNPDMHCKILP
jgi:hypothetical protein